MAALFEEGDVTLTETDLSVGGERYALEQVSSATMVREPAPANGPILMLVAGAVCLLGGTGGAGLFGLVSGVVLIVAGIVWFTLKKPLFKLRLEVPEGEIYAFECPEEERTQRLTDAVQAALSEPTDR